MPINPGSHLSMQLVRDARRLGKVQGVIATRPLPDSRTQAKLICKYEPRCSSQAYQPRWATTQAQGDSLCNMTDDEHAPPVAVCNLLSSAQPREIERNLKMIQKDKKKKIEIIFHRIFKNK